MKFVFKLLFPIFLASCSGSQTAALVRTRSLSGNSYFSSGPQLQLAEAAAKGDSAKIDEAISQGAKVNAVGNEQMTPLMWSIIRQNVNGYSRLLERGADPNFLTHAMSQYDQGRSVMMVAAACEKPEFLELALKYHGNPNAPRWVPSQTIIFEAVANKRLENIGLIHRYRGDLNKKDARGVTPIIEATYSSSYDVVYTLLLLGADPTIKNNSGSDVAAILEMFQGQAAYSFGNSEQNIWYGKVVRELQRKGLLKNTRR